MLTTLLSAGAYDAKHVPSLAQIFFSEFLGTAVLILLGVGVVANVVLKKSKGFDSGWIVITFGWAIGVFAGVYVAYMTGGHLNPAVTVMKVVEHAFLDNSATLAANVPVTFTNVMVYIAAQMLGAFVGAVCAYLSYKKHYDETDDPASKLGTFATGPAIRSYGWNVLAEFFGTFVLLAWVLVAGGTPTQVGPLGVALIILGIGLSLGGPTGYALNPARDLAPRIAHAVLPIKGKGDNDWGYAWVPVVGPLLAAVVTPFVVYGFMLAATNL